MPESRHKSDKDKMTDLVRKAIYLGAGTLFYTQENASRKLSEGLKVSREVANEMATQWDRGKQELIDSISQTVANYLADLDLTDVIRNVTKGAELEVRIRLNFDDERKAATASHSDPESQNPPRSRLRRSKRRT